MSVSRMGDFYYAMRIINILVTDWKDQPAYKFGIIDANGNVLKKFRDLKTSEEKDSFTYLHRLVFNLKRIIEKGTGSSSKLVSGSAAYLLLREGLEEDE